MALSVKNYTVRKYQQSDYALWNTFISTAKNATFLFHRDFMEYHKDRFDDFSLLVCQNDKLIAVLPANKVENEIHSHQGLSYGGIVCKKDLKLNAFLQVFDAILGFLHEHGFQKLFLKLIPSFYTRFPSEEIDYALFLVNANLYRRDAAVVLNLKEEITTTKGRIEGINKGLKHNLEIKESDDFTAFWNEILLPNLEEKHNAKPVHSSEEMQLLKGRFPDNIRLFTVYHQNKMVAGCVMFVTDSVAHCQYISGNHQKNELGSLDYLHHFLITTVFKDKTHFDFGISNEEQGRKLNEGLSFWKESFGGNIIVHDFYEVEVKKYTFLEDIAL